MNGSYQTANVNLIALPNGSRESQANAIALPNGMSIANANAVALPNDTLAYSLNLVALPNGAPAYHATAINIQTGPLWAGTWNGEIEWSPGLIWDGTQFVRYRMWDGNNWQISEGHDPDVAL